MDSYLDRVNPNLVITLNFIGKLCWLGLAGVFGIIGYLLYALEITQTGGAEVGVPGILSFTLKNAGPGLVVMVFALACAVIGTIRSKVILTPTEVRILAPSQEVGPKDQTPSRSVRECKLFGDLVDHLAKERAWAFAIINSLHQVDIESFGWSAVPENVRDAVIRSTARWMGLNKTQDHELALASPFEGWTVRRSLISGRVGNETKTWCVVSVKTREEAFLEPMASADAEPLIL